MRSRRLWYQALLVLAMGAISAARAQKAEAAVLGCTNLGCVDDCGAIWLEMDCHSCGGQAYPQCQYNSSHDCFWASCEFET